MFPDCICVHLPVQLLRVCRSIGHETRSILYSRNKFKLDRTTLNVLTHRAFAKLHSLQTRLTECSCVTGHNCQGLTPYEIYECLNCHRACKRGSGEPLDNDRDAPLLDCWRNFVTKLRSNCSPTLNLTIICDCENFQTASAFVILLETLPTISSFSVRLGQSPNHHFRQLAEHTSRMLTQTELKPFPFEQLPEEIQEAILCQTDLITTTPVSWNDFSFQDCQNTEADPDTRQLRFLRRFQGDDKRCCMQCNDIGEVCTCPSRHAAYPAKNCTCWQFPMAMFLTSKKINQLATRIFYSKNEFAIWDSTRKSSSTGRSPMERARYLKDPMIFLRALPTTSLRYLRRITFHFRSFDGSDALEDTPGYKAWIELTSTIVRIIPNLSLLTITLNFVYNVYSECWRNGDTGDAKEIWTSYQNIAEIFRIAKGTKQYRNFSIYLGSPEDDSIENYIVCLRRESILRARVMDESKSDMIERYKKTYPRVFTLSDFSMSERYASMRNWLLEPWDGNNDTFCS